MSSTQSGGPENTFSDRLHRVAEHRAPIEAAKVPVGVLPDWKSTISSNIGLPLAFLVGVLAVLVVRITSFHYTGSAMISDNADVTLAVETGAALVFSFLAFMLLPFKGPQFKMAQFVGVLVMISMMHNAVHSAPSLFGAMFSTEWATDVTTLTEPNSLYLRGEVIHFVKPEVVEEVEVVTAIEEVEEEKPLPRILRVY